MQTHPIRRRLRAVGLASMLAVATVTFVACSDDDEPEATAEASTTEAASATEAMTATAAATEAMTATASATEAMTATPAATSGATVAISAEGPLAPYLVGPNGHTLYLFTNDAAGVSNCTGGCLANWPPLLVEAGEEPTAGDGVTGELGVIEREDGAGRQVTYNGIPLYYWAADTAPGQTTGHEVGGVWFVVPPDQTTATAPIKSSGDGPGY